METDELKVGEKLLPFDIEMNDGSRLSLSDLDGKVSVLVFFRTTCPDCQEELPVIQQLYDRYRDDDTVVIACISTRDTKEEAAGYWAENDLDVPYSVSIGTLVDDYGFRAVPQVYVADKGMAVRYSHSDNPIASLEELEAEVAGLL